MAKTYLIVDVVNGDRWTEEAKTKEAATKAARAQWDALSDHDKARRDAFYVLEVDEVDEVDGDIVLDLTSQDHMKNYEVDYIDPKTGAQSPIDTITAPDGYTAADYISDCEKNADTEYVEMLHAGEVVLVELD